MRSANGATDDDLETRCVEQTPSPRITDRTLNCALSRIGTQEPALNIKRKAGEKDGKKDIQKIARVPPFSGAMVSVSINSSCIRAYSDPRLDALQRLRYKRPHVSAELD